MKTTQQLIELQRSITQGEWHAMPFNQGETIYAADNARVAETYATGKHGADATPNAHAITLVPELLAEVIRLREALSAIANKLEAQELGYMAKELWPHARSEMILSAQALLADAK